ncbi:MAG: SRPBCC domain-containing protein [Bacteroidota bacterium]
MTSISTVAQQGKATTEKKTFKRTTSISQIIQADPSVVWGLLTNASDFTRWNSTIVSLEGEIRENAKIRLKSTLDESRTFKLKVKELLPEQKLVWGDAMGKRVYTLERKNGGTYFNMTEKIGGPMFPLFANKIPSFDESFEQFTADLKKEAERVAQAK